MYNTYLRVLVKIKGDPMSISTETNARHAGGSQYTFPCDFHSVLDHHPSPFGAKLSHKSHASLFLCHSSEEWLMHIYGCMQFAHQAQKASYTSLTFTQVANSKPREIK